jgi:multidrug resistance protein, MATE family
MVARGILRGAGDVRYPAIMGVALAWALTPPLTWLLGYQAGLGALGGWIGLCAEFCAGAALFWWRLGRGGWRGAAERTRLELAPASEPGQAVAAA